MSRPDVLASGSAGERRSGKKSKASEPCLVTQRLAWLANGSNWDGTLPPPKLLPPTSGLKSASAGRRGVGDGSDCVEQAPGWDGQVADIARFPAGELPVVATTTDKARDDGSAPGEECNKKCASGAATMSTLCGGGESRCGVDQEPLIADTAANVEKRNASVEMADVRLPTWSSSGREDWSIPPTVLHSELKSAAAAAEEEVEEEAEEHAVLFDDGDEGTAAADDNSAEVNDDSAGESAAQDSICNSQVHRHANDSNLLGIAPGTNDTVSELSCSTTFSVLSAADDDEESETQLREDEDDDQESEKQLREGESAFDSSSESPNQARMATGDDDDIGVSHIGHLIQARRRWQLRAIESEHELASMRSLHARMEKGGARAMQPRPAEATEPQDPTAMMHESGSFSEHALSETSSVESGYELDDQSQTTSGVDGAVSTSSYSAGSLRVGVEPSPLGFLDTAYEAQFLRSASNTTDRLPASEARYDAASTNKDRSASPVNGDEIGGIFSDDGLGKDGAHRQREVDTDRLARGAGGNDDHGTLCDDDEQGKNGTDSHRLLREEVVELRENLRKAELRHAAAEATAVSVLQRARAAELSRDVKEIKIRNLEIRLERYTNNDKSRQEACADWRERQNSGGGESAAGGIKLDLLRPRMEPMLPVAEEGEEPLSPHDCVRNDRENTTRSSTSTVPVGPAALREPAGTVFAASSEERAGGGPAAGGGRAAFYRFRQSCAVLGAKAARAGGDAVAAAAAAAGEAAKEAMESTTAAVRDGTLGGGAGRKDSTDGRSQAGIDGGVEEYWGSDYCTSA